MRPLKARAIALAIFVLFLSFFQSCQTKNPLIHEMRPLEGKIIFSIAEGLPDNVAVGVPRIMLSMRTEKWYTCCNYSIATEVSRIGNRISVGISGINIPNICLTALGVARYQAPLDLTDGVYSLIISNRDYDDRYEVRVAGSSIEIIEKESHFTIPQQTLVSS